MATYLNLVNDVLVRLREDSVSSVSDTDYSQLIGKFINDAKREMEDSWRWTQLRQFINVTTSNGTDEYDLTGSNHRTQILNAYDDSNDGILYLVPQDWMKRQKLLGTSQNARPVWYIISGVNSSGELKVQFDPVPDGSYTVKFWCFVPQADLSADGDIMTLPQNPVVLKAWSLAISERGEDGGALFNEIMAQYRQSVGDFIAIDWTRVAPDEKDWRPV